MFRWGRRFLHQASGILQEIIYIFILFIVSQFFFLPKFLKTRFFAFFKLCNYSKKRPLLIASALGCKFLCLWSSK